MPTYNLCIIKPNKDAFSETFIQQHINRLTGNKKILYGGAFPIYDDEGKFLIKSWLGILSYLIQKRLLKKQKINIRTNALVNYLKAQKIDIVLAEFGMVGAMVTEACQLAKVPLVIHYFGADVYHNKTIEQYGALYTQAFNYASALVAVSNDMIDGLVQLGASRDKISMIPCGVDTNYFPLLDISQAPKNFLAVGRFVNKKSPLSLVKAFDLVAKEIPDAKLWMVGQGPLFDETQKLIDELGLQDKVFLTGVLNSSQIRELMKQSRCFVQHSVTASDGDKEGTPVIILEASSSGLPVVSTRHAGIIESVIDGKTGYLVDEYDIKAMAEKMMLVIQSPQLAIQLGIAGREHIIKNYNIENLIKQLDQVIQQSINTKSQ